MFITGGGGGREGVGGRWRRQLWINKMKGGELLKQYPSVFLYAWGAKSMFW